MSFEIGSTVDGYEFLDILSSSKTEIRYRVRNILAQRMEVLRLLPQYVRDDQERVERFLREMKVHARLAHPNILAFYNAAELRQQLVMTTELIEGVTLAQRLELGAMPWRDAVRLVSQALDALAYAHALGIVHRDIAPQHMIVTPEGTLKIADFGLAKTSASPTLTQDGAVLGTLKYISPEQVKGGSGVDGRSDLYSLGVILYEAVAGKPPFDSKSQFELMLAHVAEAPKPPSAVNPAIPAELERVILKAIAKDPAQRFQTAHEFRSALEETRAALEKPAANAHTQPAAPAPPVPPLNTAAGPPSPAAVSETAASQSPPAAVPASEPAPPELPPLAAPAPAGALLAAAEAQSLPSPPPAPAIAAAAPASAPPAPPLNTVAGPPEPAPPELPPLAAPAPAAAAAAPAPAPPLAALPEASAPPRPTSPQAPPPVVPDRLPPFHAEPFAGGLFAHSSAASWDARQLTIIVSAAMALFFFLAYLLVRTG